MAQKLLVEGDTDLHFITHLCMMRGLNPPKGYENETAYKKDFVSVAGNKSKLKAELKLLLKKPDSDIHNLGIVLDADSGTKQSALDTWQAIKNILQNNGYHDLIQKDDAFWQKAIEITEGYVQNNENRFREIALSKAKVHTWLAWQEKPELPLGLSVYAYQKLLNLELPLVDDFVDWFQNTFDC